MDPVECVLSVGIEHVELRRKRHLRQWQSQQPRQRRYQGLPERLTIRAVEHPLWSPFVWRNEVVDTFVEMVAGPWFAWTATGTPAINIWLRSLGAKIGHGVWCETYWLPEADLVRLGDGVTVNRGCVLQTHLFHDRIMSMDTVTLAAGATLGPHGVILPAATIAAGATVGPGSLVLRGETVPPSSRWTGNPIAPWMEARH